MSNSEVNEQYHQEEIESIRIYIRQRIQIMEEGIDSPLSSARKTASMLRGKTELLGVLKMMESLG